MKKFENIGKYKIWLKGSRKTITRCVYTSNGKSYIKWYGQMVEVTYGAHMYVTTEEY